jgi:hypothetical protein
MGKLDRLGWAAGMVIRAYGVRVGIRTNHPPLLEHLGTYLPPGWTPTVSAKWNPAQRLYERLGFRTREDDGVYLCMEWSPHSR